MLIMASFYWFEWRPAQIRTSCIKKTAEVYNKVKEEVGTLGDQMIEGLDFGYRVCIHAKGLKE